MNEIEIRKITDEEIKKLSLFSWPIWTKEISEFEWYYDDTESCYLLEGEVTVETEDNSVSFKKGDFVVFPKGLSCKWKVIKPVKKHYKFG